MSNLQKIRDISNKYNITTRTLRYYEEKGLLSSIRRDNYRCRFYDEESIRRLEQILFLRQSNLSIKDIQRLFKTSDTDEFLRISPKRLDNIDDETVSMNILKDIIMEFIHEIEVLDLTNKSDITLFNKRVKEVKTQLTIKPVLQFPSEQVLDHYNRN